MRATLDLSPVIVTEDLVEWAVVRSDVGEVAKIVMTVSEDWTVAWEDAGGSKLIDSGLTEMEAMTVASVAFSKYARKGAL